MSTVLLQQDLADMASQLKVAAILDPVLPLCEVRGGSIQSPHIRCKALQFPAVHPKWKGTKSSTPPTQNTLTSPTVMGSIVGLVRKNHGNYARKGLCDAQPCANTGSCTKRNIKGVSSRLIVLVVPF